MASNRRQLPDWEQAARDAEITLSLPGGVKMFFRRVPPGEFRMGFRGNSPDAEPVHRVVIPQEFYLGTFVVTQEQYSAVARECSGFKKQPTPSNFEGPRRPVDSVRWQDADEFCRWLTCWAGLPAELKSAQFRLPTEAELEYACRAGSEIEHYCGDGASSFGKAAWYVENSGMETHPVDKLWESHPWGFYGFHGNVREWCADIYDSCAYQKRVSGWVAREWTLTDAAEATEFLDDDDERNHQPSRVLRGGSWLDSARSCRSAFRFRLTPVVRLRHFGFRACLVPGPAASQLVRAAEPR